MFRNFKKYLLKSFFQGRNFVFVNGVGEGNSGPSEESRLSQVEQAIFAILNAKEKKTREEEEILNLLKAKQNGLRSIDPNDAVKRYFSYLFQKKIKNKQQLEPNESGFLQDFRANIELSAVTQTEKDNVAILYHNIFEKKGFEKISKIIADVRGKVAETLNLQAISSVKDYLAALKDPAKKEQLQQAAIPSKKEIYGAWANFDRKVEKFFAAKSGLGDKSREFVNFLKTYNADPNSPGVAGLKAFPEALKQFKTNGKITEAEYTAVAQNEEFRALSRERYRLANIAHLRDAQELRDSADNLGKLKETRDRALKVSSAIEEKWRAEAKAKGINVDNPQFKVSLDDSKVKEYADDKELSEGLALLRKGGITELNDESFAEREAKLKADQEQLGRERLILAQEREGELSGRLEIKRAQASLQLSLNCGGIDADKDTIPSAVEQIKNWASKNNGERNLDELSESFKALFDSNFVIPGLEEDLNSFSSDFLKDEVFNQFIVKTGNKYFFDTDVLVDTFDAYIGFKDPYIANYMKDLIGPDIITLARKFAEGEANVEVLHEAYRKFFTSFEDLKKDGHLQSLLRRVEGRNENEVRGFIDRFGEFIQQSVTVDETDSTKATFNAVQFNSLIDAHNNSLPSFTSLKEDSDYLRSQELLKQMDAKRKEESKIEMQLKTMKELKQKFGMTDEQRQIDLMKYYQTKIKEVSAFLYDNSFNENNEEDLQKLMQLNDLLKEKSKIFAQMGLDINDDKLDWTNLDVEAIKAKFTAFDERAKAELAKKEAVLNGVGSARRARRQEEGITNVSFDDDDIKTAPQSFDSAKQKEDFLAYGTKVRDSFDKVRRAGSSISFVITSREDFQKTHPQEAQMLNVKGKVYNSEIEQRIRQSQEGAQHEPMGVQMPLNVAGTKHVIYLFNDYQDKLKQRGLNLKNIEDKKKADTILSDFFEEELHHIRQDKMRDKFDAYVDLIFSHKNTKEKVAEFYRKWKTYYNEPNTSLKVAVAEADAANNGKKYSQAYAPIGDLWEEICAIARDPGQMDNFTADFSIFRNTNEAERELKSRARASHDKGLYGEEGEQEEQTASASGQEGPAKEDSPQEKADDILGKIKTILSTDGDDDEYVLNLKTLKKDIDDNNIKHDGIDFESIRDKFTILQNGLSVTNIDEATVEELKKLYEKYETNLQKIRTQIDEIKGAKPYEMSFWADIWFNTRLLSLNSSAKIVTEAWAHLKEEHETMESFKAHLVGSEIGGSTVYGSKQKAKNQSDETNKVSEWKKIFDGLNDPVIQEMLMKCKNEFELKAIVEWKAEKIGDLDFGSDILRDAIERSLGKKVYSRKQAEQAYDDRFGPNSAVDNNKKSRNTYNSKANEYKETVRADQNMFDIWYGMVEKVESAKNAGQTPPWVDMRQYDGAFRYCIEDGKSTPQKSFYYFFKGYHLGILSDSAATELGQIELNKFPPIEQVQVVTANHKKRVKFNPPEDIQRVMDSQGYNFYTEVDFIAALHPFNKDGSANNPDYLIFEWWLSGERFSESKMAEDRLDKAIGRFRDPPDPDWGEEMLWHLSERSLKNTLNRKEDSSDKIAVSGMSNLYKTLIYYGGMMRDDLLEKTLKKFVNIDRYMFEESFKKDATTGAIQVENNTPVRDTSKPTAPVYGRGELSKTSVMPPFLGLGAYRFALTEAARAYASSGGKISEARKELIKYGAALGILSDDDGTEFFIKTRLQGAEFTKIYNNYRRSKNPSNADAMKSACTNAIKTMPLTHTAPLGPGGPCLNIPAYADCFGEMH